MNQQQYNTHPPKSQFLMIDSRLYNDPRFYKMGAAMGLYIKLRSFSNRQATWPVSPSCRNLAKFLGCSENTITNQLKHLVKLGFIAIQRQYNAVNTYTFPFEAALLSGPQEVVTAKVQEVVIQENCDLTREGYNSKLESEKQEFKLDKSLTEIDNKPMIEPDLSHSITMPKPKAALRPPKVEMQKPEAAQLTIDDPPQSASAEASDLIKGTISWEDYTKKLFTKDVLKEFLAIRVDSEFQAAVRKKIDDCHKKGREWLFYPYALSQYLKDNPKIEFESKVIFSALNNPENWEEIRKQANTAYLNARGKWEAQNFLVIQHNKVDSLMTEPNDGKTRRPLTGLSDLYKQRLAEKSENIAKES